jgi:thermostable 8-oxoguanine DNA glycosylase
MSSAGLVDQVNLSRDYEIVEDTFLAWCQDLEAPPAAFDLFLWEFQRGRISVAA